MTQNLSKKGKILFETAKADFCWNISPDFTISENNENYGQLLRNIFRYNPAMHEFDTDRFTVFEK